MTREAHFEASLGEKPGVSEITKAPEERDDDVAPSPNGYRGSMAVSADR